MRTLKLSNKQEAHEMGVVEISVIVRRVDRYAREELNLSVAVRYIQTRKSKFRFIDARNDVVCVKGLLRQKGTLRLPKPEDAI